MFKFVFVSHKQRRNMYVFLTKAKSENLFNLIGKVLILTTGFINLSNNRSIYAVAMP